MKLIIDNQYFPNYNYYKKLIDSKYVIIEQYDRHQKKSFANRCVIAGSNGLINLTVPLKKGRSQITVSRDIRISNAENWQLKHWRSIASSYNNSPWFKYFSDSMAVLFLKRYEFLLDWNLACLDWTLKFLKVDLKYELSSAWQEKQPGDVLDLRRTILPGEEKSVTGIRYPQVFESKFGFQPGLSILDIISCEGPKETVSLLKNWG